MSKIWSVVLRLCPTWFLQLELSGREGGPFRHGQRQREVTRFL